jgi:hypothetical protein
MSNSKIELEMPEEDVNMLMQIIKDHPELFTDVNLVKVEKVPDVEPGDTLPEQFEKATATGLLQGEPGWIGPWGIYAASDRSMWMNGNYPIHKSPRGTVSLQIVRSGDYIYVNQDTIGDHAYSPGEPCYFGEFTPLPVRLINSRKFNELVGSIWS